MSARFNVVSLGPAGLGFIFDPIVAGLRERGHEIVHYTDFSRFGRESADALKAADVFVTISNFRCTRELMMAAARHRVAIHRDRRNRRGRGDRSWDYRSQWRRARELSEHVRSHDPADPCIAVLAALVGASASREPASSAAGSGQDAVWQDSRSDR